MHSIQNTAAGANHLRFVFSDKVVSLGLGPDATFGEIALALGDLVDRHRRHPLAIDVTFADPRLARRGN